MALTYGFYNSIEGDRVYDAIQFGRIFDGIIKDGVYATYEKGMMVIASANPAEVIIQPGRAWFNHTWNYNDANIIFEAPAPEVLLERYDALVLEINEELSARENSFKWVTGTPSSRPERPTLTNTSTIHQYPLCYVHRYPETTMIYTRDITNMIGTSECPFATGVLEGIDLDAWINQWDDEFHNWETTKKTQFEVWMLSQETAFTTWYNAFKDQMASDVQEVEDFVDYLESVLDASTAIHLQEEIDDLRNEISSGSHITVTTINPELYGRNVTITEAGGTVFTEKFDNTGVAVFKSVPYVGNLTISSTYGTQTAERVVNTPYYARYSFAIAFWAATVNIVGDPEMSGSSVTVKDSNETVVGTVVLDSEGTGVYIAIKPDTYKFSVTHGGQTMEVSLAVTQETTYNVTIHAGFNWRGWVDTAQFLDSTDYNSLEEVLADEEAVRELCLEHACVDYLAAVPSVNADIETIINNDLFAKWVNDSDYSLDVLGANIAIKALMDTADKYGYGEWVITDNTTTPVTWGPKGNVPIMTSDTAPYGKVSVSSTLSGGSSAYTSYYAFNRDGASKWYCQSTNTPEWIQYKFANPTCIKRFYCWFDWARPVKLQASNTGNTNDWTDLTELLNPINGEKMVQDFDNDTFYLYYRLYSPNSYYDYGDYMGICELQFYGRELSVSVPVMTGDTTPYGEAFGTTLEDSNYGFYKPFDGTKTNTYDRFSSYASPAYVGYDFGSPVSIEYFFVEHLLAPTASEYLSNNVIKLQGNNSLNGTWEDVYSYTYNTNPTIKDSVNSNHAAYRYWRLYTETGIGHMSGGNFFEMYTLQFYGKDYSEKEFEAGTTRKWLYDHGLELETMSASDVTGVSPNVEPVKEDSQLKFSTSSGQYSIIGTTSSIDLTDYSVYRANLGNQAFMDTLFGNLAVGTTKDISNPTTNLAIREISSPNAIGVDISSLNQNAYIFVIGGYNNARMLTIKELWLE